MKYCHSLLIVVLSLPNLILLSQNDIPKKSILAEGLISSDLNERDFTISPDGKEVYFTRSHYNNNNRAIIRAENKNGRYSEVEVATFSGRFNDLEPFFSPDGKRIYFASNRNIEQTSEKRDYDIWYVEKLSNGEWSDAFRVNDIINSDRDEFYPAITANGNIYFTSSRENGIGTEDIFISEFKDGKYQKPKPLDLSINSESYEFNAYVNAEETLIIFSAYGRKDGLGNGDLYYSKKKNGKWNKAINLGKSINSKSLDYSPFYDEKKQILYFTSQYSEDVKNKLTVESFKKYSNSILNGYGNIYIAKITL